MRLLAPFSPLRWLAGLVTACALTAAQATPAEFDALWHDMHLRNQFGNLDNTQQQAMARLQDALPANDTRRAAMLHYLECVSQPGDPVATYETATQWFDIAQAQKREPAEQLMANLCRLQLKEDGADTPPQLPEVDALVAQAQRLGEPLWLGHALAFRGGAYSLVGQHARALQDLLAATLTYTEAGLTGHADRNLLLLGIAYRRMGDPINAEIFLNRAFEDAQERQAWQGAINARLQLGYLHEDQNQLTQAEAVFRDALRLATQRREMGMVAAAELALAHTHLLQKAFAPAKMMLTRAERRLQTLGAASQNLTLAHYRGALAVGMGQREAGVAQLSRAIEGWSASGQKRYLAEALTDRAQAFEAMGRTESALRDTKRLLLLRQSLHDDLQNQQALWMREQFAAAQRQGENARLQAAQQAQAVKLEAVQQSRRWQGVALVISALLLSALGVMLWRQYKMARKLRRLTVTDSLTRVLNRRGIQDRALQIWAQARRTSSPVCVLTFDIDHFKRVNDTLGHAGGDAVLVRVAQLTRNALRPQDLIGRIGGEEFLVLLPAADLATARQVGERLRRAVESSDWASLKDGLHVTLSWGLTLLHDHDEDLSAALKRADDALYQAKHSGRNRGVVAGEPSQLKAPAPGERAVARAVQMVV